LKCDGTRAETRFRLSAKRTSLFKSVGASVQSTTSSRDVRINGSNAEYTMFRVIVKGTGYPLHSSVSPSLPLPCVTVCHRVSTRLYHIYGRRAVKTQLSYLLANGGTLANNYMFRPLYQPSSGCTSYCKVTIHADDGRYRGRNR
jgi:hypothetical protein